MVKALGLRVCALTTPNQSKILLLDGFFSCYIPIFVLFANIKHFLFNIIKRESHQMYEVHLWVRHSVKVTWKNPCVLSASGKIRSLMQSQKSQISDKFPTSQGNTTAFFHWRILLVVANYTSNLYPEYSKYSVATD